eukprot:jgi/Botrbrau1/5290/Bobra.0391s0011.1
MEIGGSVQRLWAWVCVTLDLADCGTGREGDKWICPRSWGIGVGSLRFGRLWDRKEP